MGRLTGTLPSLTPTTSVYFPTPELGNSVHCHDYAWLWCASLSHDYGMLHSSMALQFIHDRTLLFHDFTIRLVTEFDSTTRFNAIG